MFARPQLSTKRCWNSDQVEQECSRVLRAAFDSGDATTANAYREADGALQGMTAFLKQAEATLALEAKLQMERDEKARNAPSTEGLPAEWGVDAYTKMHGDNPVQFRPAAASAATSPEPSRSFEEELEAELDAAMEARDEQRFRASFVTEVVQEPLEKAESLALETPDPATDDDLSDLAEVDPPPASNDEFDAHPLLAPDELDATLGDLPEPDVLILSESAEDSLQMSAPQALEKRAAERAPRSAAPAALAPVIPRKPSVQRKIQDAQSFAKGRASGKASPRRTRPAKPA
jgi:hypothetical protein